MIFDNHIRPVRFNVNEYISPDMIDTWKQEVTVLRTENRNLKLEIGYLMDQVAELQKKVGGVDDSALR